MKRLHSPLFKCDQDSRPASLCHCNAIHPNAESSPGDLNFRRSTILVRGAALHAPHLHGSKSLHILVLSPHRNDAAFSLGLAMEGWLAAKHRVTVLGVFTRSATAPFSDADTVHPNDLLSYVSGMRRKEDAELLKLLPKLRMEDLNLKDAPIRLRCAPGEEYAREPSADDSAVAKIHKALAKLDAEMKIEAVLLPLGLGHHVDHLVVRNATLDFSTTRACAFYEDLPDALRDGDTFDANRDIDPATEAELATLGGSFTPVVSNGDETSIKRKLKMVSTYASQIDEPTMQIISRFATRYGAGERVWANAAWLSLELGT